MQANIMRRAGYAMLGVTLAACADRSPTGNEPEQFKALGSEPNFAFEASKSAAIGDAASAAVYEGAALAVRLGARPTDILVSVDGEVNRYEAVVVATVQELSPGDTALRRSLIAWNREGERLVALLDVTTLADVGSFSSPFEPASDPRARAQGTWVNLVRGARYDATTGDASIVVADIGGSCNSPDGRSDPRCSLADFSVDVDGLFRLGGTSPRAGLDAVRIQTEATRVNGVIIGRGDDGDRDHRRRHPELDRRRQHEERR
jgi:hypothetical protein